MSDAVVSSVGAERSRAADLSASPSFRQVGPITALQAIMEEHGLDGSAIIASEGIAPGALDRPENFIRVSVLGDLLTRCADLASCPQLGISLGARAGVESLGVVGSLMRSCDTLGDAIRALQAHLQILDRGTLVQLEEADDAVVLSCLQYGSAGRGGGIIVESLLATICTALRELCGHDWFPAEVHLARRVPEDSSAFRSFFRAPIRFNQELTALVFPRRDLALKVSTADPELRLALQRAVRELEAIASADLVEKMKRSLRQRLTSGCSCEEVSRWFSVDRRTMNRRLKAAGTSFRTVLDELKFEVARQLVSDTELPLAQISAALNFSEPAAFTRAFARWSGGISPQKWRHLDRADNWLLRSRGGYPSRPRPPALSPARSSASSSLLKATMNQKSSVRGTTQSSQGC
jgi:AraC-like DNA-binding protein